MQDSYIPLARLDSWNKAHFTEQGLSTPTSIKGTYYFHCNASGMPKEMTDKDGNIVWRARYATWGKLIFENVTRYAPTGFTQNLRMQGQYHDRGTNLHYNTFRYYDTATGRFISEDPIGLWGGYNLYLYAPNPFAWIDPWGWIKCREATRSNRGVILGRKISLKETIKRTRNGKDVYVETRADAKKLARKAFSRKPVVDPKHADKAGSTKGRLPHAHGHDRPEHSGHIFYPDK